MSTLLRESERVGKLHAFRLSDVPVEIRMKYASQAAAAHRQSVFRVSYGVAPVQEERWGALMQAVDIFHAWVVAPSDRVYRVSEDAWQGMLVEAAKERKALEREELRERVAA